MPRRPLEEIVVHLVIAVVGAIGVACAVAEHDFGGGATLAGLLVVVGIAGIVRRPEL